jgi:CBS domain-containing protein
MELESPEKKQKRDSEIPGDGTEFLRYLLETRIEENLPRDTTKQTVLLKRGAVMCCNANEHITKLFKKLATENFLSCPVIDSRNRYCGMVDLFDLVRFTTLLFRAEKEEDWAELWDKRADFQEARVGEIMQSPWFKPDPFHPVHEGFTLFHGWETLAKLSLHRVPILDENEDVVGINTQSMCISILRQNLAKLGVIQHLRVSEMLSHLSGNLITVKDSEKTLSAFNKMVEANVSGLAIVDEEGVLQGTISIRDLRGVGMGGERFSRLFMPVRQFKALVAKEYPKLAPETHYAPGDVPKGALYVLPDDTLQTVIEKMNDGNIHRVFVVPKESADQGKPRATHVIAQRDVLMVVLLKLGICSAK